MDTKFQTSFIPKKAIISGTNRGQSKPVNILLVIAVMIFLLALSLAGGVFGYKKMLISRINGMNSDLSRAKNSFEPESIKKWNRLDQRIDSATKILSAHTAVSPIFDFLENDTLATVKFENFSYSLRDNGESSLTMTGRAKNFGSVALQSDIFGQEKYIKNPVFSNLNPDQTGDIVFNFTSTLDPALVSYKNKQLSSLPPSN
jgi:hypothetical protein